MAQRRPLNVRILARLRGTSGHVTSGPLAWSAAKLFGRGQEALLATLGPSVILHLEAVLQTSASKPGRGRGRARFSRAARRLQEGKLKHLPSQPPSANYPNVDPEHAATYFRWSGRPRRNWRTDPAEASPPGGAPRRPAKPLAFATPCAKNTKIQSKTSNKS